MIRQNAYYPTPEGYYIFEMQCKFCYGRGGEVFLSPTRNPVDSERYPALPAVWMHGQCWKKIALLRKARRARRLARMAEQAGQVAL